MSWQLGREILAPQSRSVHAVIELRTIGGDPFLFAIHLEKPRERQEFAYRRVEAVMVEAPSWRGERGSVLEWLNDLRIRLTRAESCFLREWRLVRSESDHCFAMSLAGIGVSSDGDLVAFRKGAFRIVHDSKTLLTEQTVEHEREGKIIASKYLIDPGRARILSSAAHWFPAEPITAGDLVVASSGEVRAFHSQTFVPEPEQPTIQIEATWRV